MKKQFLCTFVLIGLLQSTPAQSQSQRQSPNAKPVTAHPWSISLSAGPAFPTGNFATKEPGTPLSGHAMTGAVAELSLGYSFNRYISALLSAAYQVNSVGTDQNLFYLSIHNDPWKIARFLLGPSVSLPLGKSRFSMQARAQAGLLKTSLPGFTYLFDTGDGPQAITRKVLATPFPWAFSYQAGAGLKWQSAGRLFLLLDATYLHATPRFNRGVQILINQSLLETVEYQYKQTISSVQVTLGAGIHIF